MEKHTPPSFIELGKANAFHCPHCNTYARQKFYTLMRTGHRKHDEVIQTIGISTCDSCNKDIIWLVDEQKMIYPSTSIAPEPLDDMPEDVKVDYEEAREIVRKSPRGAAALLRLCTQKLMPHLGEKGKNLNDDIAGLVQKGLSIKIQQALDSLRVIGNNAVHPGQIDLKDDTKTAMSLFELINVIVDNQISQPKRIEEIFDNLPQTARDAIQKRDNKS